MGMKVVATKKTVEKDSREDSREEDSREVFESKVD